MFCVCDYTDQRSKPKIGGKTPRIFFLVYFTFFRFVIGKKNCENTKEEVRRMTRERKKETRRERQPGKEKEIVSAFQIEKDCSERQQKSATTCRRNITINSTHSSDVKKLQGKNQLLSNPKRIKRLNSAVLVHLVRREILNVGYEMISFAVIQVDLWSPH